MARQSSTRRRRLETRLLNLATPLFLLDRRRRVIFFNDGCERLTGWQASEVIGAVCDYTTDAAAGRMESLCGSLAAPPDVYEAGQPVTTPVTLQHKTGQALSRLVHFTPLKDADGTVDLVLGVFTELDGTEKSQHVSAAHRLHAELAALRSAVRQRYGFETFIARGEAMRRVTEQMAVARSSDAAVLISGETGTGKERIAHTIHNESPFSNQSFVPLDCRRLPVREIRRTLRRILQLDEPADERTAASAAGMQPAAVYLQSVDRLARDVQELLVHTFQDPPTDRKLPRLIAGTDADLQKALNDESLRTDFYYLISTIRIDVPPLRDRQDLELLAQQFLEDLNRQNDVQIGEFTAGVWDQFHEYQWPGNLDELRTVIEEARQNCDGIAIEPRHLPFRFRTGLDAQTVGPLPAAQQPLEEYLAHVEAERISSVLQQVRQNKTQAAKMLGITRPRLYRRMQALGIEDPDERPETD